MRKAIGAEHTSASDGSRDPPTSYSFELFSFSYYSVVRELCADSRSLIQLHSVSLICVVARHLVSAFPAPLRGGFMRRFHASLNLQSTYYSSRPWGLSQLNRTDHCQISHTKCLPSSHPGHTFYSASLSLSLCNYTPTRPLPFIQ